MPLDGLLWIFKQTVKQADKQTYVYIVSPKVTALACYKFYTHQPTLTILADNNNRIVAIIHLFKMTQLLASIHCYSLLVFYSLLRYCNRYDAFADTHVQERIHTSAHHSARIQTVVLQAHEATQQ